MRGWSSFHYVARANAWAGFLPHTYTCTYTYAKSEPNAVSSFGQSFMGRQFLSQHYCLQRLPRWQFERAVYQDRQRSWDHIHGFSRPVRPDILLRSHGS